MTQTSPAYPENLDKIFYPRSVAVVGTNNNPGAVPFDIFHNILKDNFQGTVYPVSPGARSVASVRSYKYVIDIEDPVDLAILVFPSSVCHLALEQCGEKGIKAVIIISAGFREVGGAGVDREEKIKEIARRHGMSFIGPNCLGVINTDPKTNLNASFARQMPEEGNIGFLSQSGALCTAVLDYARAKHIGFSKFVSFGNKADVSEIDLLYYLRDDPKTKVILLYLEEISDGSALMEAARNIVSTTGKPILAIKSGRTGAGAAAAASHTGSLAGSDEVCDAAMRQSGIIRCDTIEDMFNRAIAFAYQPLPADNRVAIITNAGGPGVLATDQAIKDRLRLGKFSDETTAVLKKELPATANIKNPVDVIGDARADRYRAAMNATLADPDVDGALVILTPQSMTDIETIAEEVARVAEETDKPVYTSFMGEADVAAGIDILQRHRIPHYILPESMCDAFACAWDFKERMARDRDHPEPLDDVDPEAARKVLREAADAGRTHLPAEDAVKALAAYGLPIAPSRLATSPEDAAAAVGEIGAPVVMKVISPDIVHKFDVGGVVLNVNGPDAAAEAYDRIVKNARERAPEANLGGVMVQKMVAGGQEVILGLKRDPSFGPVVMFGFGGIFVEVFKDVSFRVAPIGALSARRMIQEIRAFPLLSGARGSAARDVAVLEDCLRRLSRMGVDLPEIKELDVNPLMVMNQGEGAWVVDARIML